MNDYTAEVTTAADVRNSLGVRSEAFGKLVSHFQDMVFGCAYARLGDRGQAQDVAQDSFLIAWQTLPKLREPMAFRGWLQRIVIRQCTRLTRRRHPETNPLDRVLCLHSPLPEPSVFAERQERATMVRSAIAELTPNERITVILFYIKDYSREEVAIFLGVSPIAIKKRLASARAKLRERLITMIQDDIQEVRPSNSTAFSDKILAFTKLFSGLVDEGVSLVRCLNRLAENETDVTFRAVIEDVNREIQEGNSLSRALAMHPQYFDERYTQAIRRGEVGGNLDIVLQQLASGELYRSQA